MKEEEFYVIGFIYVYNFAGKYLFILLNRFCMWAYKLNNRTWLKSKNGGEIFLYPSMKRLKVTSHITRFPNVTIVLWSWCSMKCVKNHLLFFYDFIIDTKVLETSIVVKLILYVNVKVMRIFVPKKLLKGFRWSFSNMMNSFPRLRIDPTILQSPLCPCATMASNIIFYIKLIYKKWFQILCGASNLL